MERVSAGYPTDVRFAGLWPNKAVRTLRQNDNGMSITPSKGLYHLRGNDPLEEEVGLYLVLLGAG